MKRMGLLAITLTALAAFACDEDEDGEASGTGGRGGADSSDTGGSGRGDGSGGAGDHGAAVGGSRAGASSAGGADVAGGQGGAGGIAAGGDDVAGHAGTDATSAGGSDSGGRHASAGTAGAGAEDGADAGGAHAGGSDTGGTAGTGGEAAGAGTGGTGGTGGEAAGAGTGGTAGTGGSASTCLGAGVGGTTIVWNEWFGSDIPGEGGAGGTPRNDRALDIIPMASGALIAGWTGGQLGDEDYAFNDGFVRKIGEGAGGDPEVLWTYQFGGSSNESAYAITAGATPDKVTVVAVAGITASDMWGDNRGEFDGFVIKLIDEGDSYAIDWTRQFGTEEDEYIHDVAMDADLNVFVVGRTLGSLGELNLGGSDLYARKIGADGTLATDPTDLDSREVWTHQFGTEEDEQAYGVAVDGEGSVFVAGYTLGDLAGPSAGGSDAVLRKLNASGEELWTRQFGTEGSDAAHAVAVDAEGNAYVGGQVGGPFGCNEESGSGLVRKYDTDGNVVWTHQFDGQVGAIAVRGDDVVVAGSVYSGESSDAMVYRLDTDGNPGWMQVVQDGDEDEWAEGVGLSSTHVVTAGYDFTLNANEAFYAKLVL